MVLEIYAYAVLLIGVFLAGFAGSLLGLGGGVFLIPLMTLPPLSLDLHTAIGASIVAVVATSASAVSRYLQEHLTNLRLALYLEVATTPGAVGGALLATTLRAGVLSLIFAAALGYAATYILLHPKETARERAQAGAAASVASGLGLQGVYVDLEDGATYRYRVRRPAVGFAISGVAGVASGLLGIGGGVIKVPAMYSVMKVPMKVAVATSNFMVGVTAAASAFIYLGRGYIDPILSAVVIAGVFLGAKVGSRVFDEIRSRALRVILAPILLGAALLMVLKGLGILPGGG